MTLPLRPLGPRPTRPVRRPVRRTRRPGVRLVHASALVLGLALAACGGAGAAPVAGDTTQVAPAVPGDGDDATDGGGGDQMVPEEITIVDALPAGTPAVEMAPGSSDEPFAVFLQEAVVDGDRVTVSFNGGETPCFVVDHTGTDETDDRVIVSVFVSVPDPDADCSQQGIFLQSVSVQLQAPLGDRPLKDGSRTVPEDAQA